jgi:hypothetical protein
VLLALSTSPRICYYAVVSHAKDGGMEGHSFGGNSEIAPLAVNTPRTDG